MKTIPQILQERTIHQADKTLFIFLDEKTLTECTRLTYAQLDTQARGIAIRLESHFRPGDRALMIFPPGLDFISAFFGCLYAGLIPVPVYPPSRNQKLERLLTIIKDAGATVVLTTSKIEEKLRIRLNEEFGDLTLDTISTDQITAASNDISSFDPYPATPDDLAFLQYTSGSTGQPKGVKISHGNLIHNAQVIAQAFDLSEKSVGCGWLPVYHDMGLVGKILQTIFICEKTVLMSPTAFLRHPLGWLQTISRYRVTTSGAPNFAYELCIRKFSPEVCEGLDLSTWELAFCGAEPVRADTARRFVKTFAPYGFQTEAFYPCYGMAEATLFITGGRKESNHRVLTVDRLGLQQGRIQCTQPDSPKSNLIELVSCGHPWLGMEVRIVDPQSGRTCPDDTVGEIWVAGNSIAQGYMNNLQVTRETFQARTLDGEGPYLRTGDLGFLHSGELFVTGRLKDIIIIRGRNYYPQDIEDAVEGSHPAIQSSKSIAFAIEREGEERLVVAVEVDRHALKGLDVNAVVSAMREAVTEAQELPLFAVVLLKPGRLPRTSSGKVQRTKCRHLFLTEQLDPVALWRADNGGKAPKSDTTAATLSATTADELIHWLREYAARRINSRLMDERRCITPAVVLELGNRGLLGMSIPREYGGMGLSDVDTLRVIQQLGAIDLSLAAFVGIHLALGAHPIIHHAHPELRARLLPQMAKGRTLAAFAITEPGAGSNPRAMVATGVPDERGGWHLNGDKYWIGNGSWAGVVNVFVRLMDAQGQPQGITGFVIEADNPGLHHGPEALTMGMRGMVQNSLHLHNAPITEKALLGEAGAGFAVAQDTMLTGRLGIAAMSVGAIKRCAQLLHRYAERRTIGTGRLLDNPVTLERLTFMDRAATAVDALTHRLADIRDQGEVVPEFGYAVCKISGPEFLWQAVDWLMQGLGGRGYMENNGVPQMLRDARLLRIFEGPTETLQMYLGQAVLHHEEEIRRFIAHRLGSPQTAERLQIAMTDISETGHENLGYFSEPLDQRHWLAFRCGELVTWSMLAAALDGLPLTWRGRGHQDALDWAKQQFAERLHRLIESKDTCIATTAKELTERISTYTDTIGKVEQGLPCEDRELDSMLRLDDTETKSVPVQPSSKELEQNNLLIDCHFDDRRNLKVSKDFSYRRNDKQGNYFVPSPKSASSPVEMESRSGLSAEDIQEWLLTWAAKEMKIKADPDKPLSYHVDSVTATEFVLALEDWLQITIQPDRLWNLPSITALAEYLAEQKARSGPMTVKKGSSTKDTPEESTTPTYPKNELKGTSKRVDLPVVSIQPLNNSQEKMPSFSLYFFGNDQGSNNKYGLILEAARYADQHGLEAVWTPERHFHPFGGSFPNPAVLGAALARTTKRIHIRSGSVVLTLHHPVRVAEDWAVVDKLSAGRVGMSVTAGWNPNDFVLDPSAYEERFKIQLDRLDAVRRLWRGEVMAFPNGKGEMVKVRIYPRPVQKELPIWLTCNRRREGFVEAGVIGANVLTALLSQTPEELEENIDAYRRARAEHGHDPATGQVTLMLHTFIGDDEATVKELVRYPLIDYLRSSFDLWRQGSERLDDMSPKAQKRLLDYAFERYYQTSTLMGIVDSCRQRVQCFKEMGVDEIACLVDFGLSMETIMNGIKEIGCLAQLPGERIEPLVDMPSLDLSRSSQSENKAQTGTWLHTEVPRTDAKLRLFCLPFAGGNAGVFKGWGELFPPSIEVIAIDAPQGLERMDDLLQALTPALLPKLDLPFAFYGHSVGALLAFEQARHLHTEVDKQPVHLFVAAQHAPHLPFPHPSHAELLTPTGLAFLERQVPAEILARFNGQQNSLWRRMVKKLGPGMRIQNENYNFRPDTPLDCPITALYGNQDSLLGRDQLEAWREHTASDFQLHTIAGGHLFLREQQEVLVEFLVKILGKHMLMK
jgi:natural product biosynthesis luciferase-like monooxygenase protein